MAAEQNYVPAIAQVGLYYEKGLGTKRSDTEAFKWYKLVADQGDADAQYKIGLCYENGIGVNQDFEKALEYYNLSSNKN